MLTPLWFSSAASTVLCATYGWIPLGKEGDPLVERINELMHRLVRACLPGAYLVEIFPSMKHLPTWMAKWKREGLEWYRKDSVLFKSFLEDVGKKKASNIFFSVGLLHLTYIGYRRLAQFHRVSVSLSWKMRKSMVSTGKSLPGWLVLCSEPVLRL